MSNGSHDQLYLALRLASLESWLQAHEPIPFVVDDILLNFDDARVPGRSAALAELSRHTQVLFFTHHRHLVELAAAHLPADVLFVHDLPGPIVVPLNLGPALFCLRYSGLPPFLILLANSHLWPDQPEFG